MSEETKIKCPKCQSTNIIYGSTLMCGQCSHTLGIPEAKMMPEMPKPKHYILEWQEGDLLKIFPYLLTEKEKNLIISFCKGLDIIWHCQVTEIKLSWDT